MVDLLGNTAISAGQGVPIDPTREVDALTRLMGGFRQTPQGRASLAENVLGVPVRADASGALYAYDERTNRYVPYDRPEFNVRDVFDLGGVVTEAAPAVLNPLTRGVSAVTGAMGLGALGSGLRQAISGALPGQEDMTMADRAGQVATSALLAGGGQALASGAARAFDAVRPQNLFARYMNRQLARPGQQEVMQAAQAADMPLSPGQQTGRQNMLTLEGYLRRNPSSGDYVQAFDDRQTQAALQRLSNSMEVFSNQPSPPATMGASVKQNFDGLVDRLANKRRAESRVLFEQVRQANPEAYFEVPNAVNALDELISEFNVPGGGDASAAIVNRLRKIRNAWRTEVGYKPIRPLQMQRLLQIYGNAARGKGQIFKDLDTGQQRMIAARLREALEADLDEIADLGIMPGSNRALDADAAQVLRAARDNYRQNSRAINALEDSAIGKLMDGQTDPTIIAERLLAQSPTQLRTTFGILNDAKPGLAQQVKRSMFEDVLQRSGLPQNDAPMPLDDPFSFQRVINNFRASPLWGVVTPTERVEMLTTMRALEAMQRRMVGQGSPTTPLAQVGQIVEAVGAAPAALQGGAPVTPGMLAGMAMGAGQLAARIRGPRAVAEMLFDPNGRKALIELTRTKPGTQRATRAATYLAGMLGAEDVRQPSPPAELIDPRIGAATRSGTDLLAQ